MMRHGMPFLASPPEPAALLRLADGWAEALEDTGAAYRAVHGFVTALAAVADGADQRAWSLVRAALATHRLTQLLRRDPLVAYAWRSGASDANAVAMRDDLMLRHPVRDPMVGRADPIARNVHAATTSLPACDAMRDRRRLIARMADSIAESRQGAEVLAITPGYMREAEASIAGPAGRIVRWVALLPTAEQAAEISRAVPLPWIEPMVGSTLATLMRGDLLGSFDLVYCKGIESLGDSAAEALAVAAFARLKPGGRMLLGCQAPAAIDAAFWSLGGQHGEQARDEARLARLVTALPPREVASRALFASMNEAIAFLEVEKRS
jgi:hypothetical protein